MHAAVERHRAAIEELCRRYGVTKLDVFGSATREDFDEARSDVDFLVEFEMGARCSTSSELRMSSPTSSGSMSMLSRSGACFLVTRTSGRTRSGCEPKR